MKKTLIAAALTAITGSALAEVNCSTSLGEEALEVKVIDTFLERTAFITRVTPTQRIPVLEVGVKSMEKASSIAFVNIEADFSLVIDKLYPERRLPPIYRGRFAYGDMVVDMDCTME